MSERETAVWFTLLVALTMTLVLSIALGSSATGVWLALLAVLVVGSYRLTYIAGKNRIRIRFEKEAAE